ncbi:MAG: DNA pilot protein [Microvirus sp.]|nr:MAG: DNA pilot protein [Microvirus sp.]
MDALGFAGSALGAVGSIYSSRQANSANNARTNMETMVNLYEGQKTRDFNAEQAQLGRDWSAQQADLSRAYNTNEANASRAWDQSMFDKSTAYNTAEQEKARAFNASEAATARGYNSYEAGLSRNFNASEAQKSRDFTAGQASQQMSFQERMRATQYQTAMADMRASGLNPMLAYSQGGAGTPIGASGSSSSASSSPASISSASSGSASIGSPSGPTASSGTPGASTASGSAAHAGHPQAYVRPDLPSLLSAAYQVAQIDNVKAQTENAKADTENKRGELIGGEGPTTWKSLESSSRAKLLLSETETEIEKRGLSKEQQSLVREEVKNAVEQRKQIQANTGNTAADTVLKTLSQSEKRASSKYWSENPETYGYGQILKLLGEGVGSALGLSRIFK